jgi:hypothetical protein
MTVTKMQGSLGLFVLLVIILMVKPIIYNNMYNNVLGRLFLIVILLFFATTNVTLGLLVALIMIIGTNVSFIEGFESQKADVNTKKSKSKSKSKPNSNSSILPMLAKLNSTGTTIGTGDDGVKSNVGQIHVVTSNYNSKSKSKDGVDRVSAEQAVKSKNSNQIPVTKENFVSLNVAASDPSASTNGFVSGFRSY